jgi:hypothetical protein
VTVRLTRWRRQVSRLVLVALMATLVPLPVLASEAQPAGKTKTKTAQVSLRQVVSREAARTPLAASSARTAQPDTPKRSGSFFKTPVGILALAVMAAGTGYAIYSSSHDRITSPAKK